MPPVAVAVAAAAASYGASAVAMSILPAAFATFGATVLGEEAPLAVLPVEPVKDAAE